MKNKYLIALAAFMLYSHQFLSAQNSELLDQYKSQLKFIGDFRKENKDSALVLAHINKDLAEKSGSPWAIAKAHTQIGLVLRSLYRYEESIMYHKKALAYAKKSDSVKLEADLLNDLAGAMIAIGQERRSIDLLRKSIPIYKNVNDVEGLLSTYYNLGFVFKFLGNIDSAQYYLQLTIDLSEKIPEFFILANNLLGNIKSEEGKYRESLQYMLTALSTAEKINDKREIAAELSNIAIIYKRLDDYERAEEAYLQSIKISTEMGDDDVHFSQFNLAILYSDTQDYKKAIKYYRQALKRRELVREERFMMTAAATLADTYFKIGNLDSSDYYVSYTNKLLPKVNAISSKASALEVLGLINMNKGNLRNAANQLIGAYNIYKKLGYDDALSESAYSLYELARKQGDNNSAINYLEEHIQIKDSIESTEQIMEIARMDEDFKHEKEILQKQNAISTLESKEQIANLRITLLILVIVLVGTVMIVGFWLARIRIRTKERKAKELEAIGQFKESMTGMIAHDLKNPLGIILGTESEKPSTKHMAGQMLNLVNNMLDINKFEKAEVVLNKQPKALLDLVSQAIEQVRPLSTQKNITIECDIDASHIGLFDESYLERVVVNFLTNAIKYSPNNGTIVVFSNSHPDGDLEIEIRDQGTGIAPENIEKIFDAFGQIDPKKSGVTASTGLGLSFCKLALEAHGSKIKVDSEVGKGTTFRFNIPSSDLKTMKANAAFSEINSEALSAEEKKHIINHLPQLNALKMHDAFAIEQVLAEIKKIQSNTIHQWAEEVLNAAYNNNQNRYDELLDLVESK